MWLRNRFILLPDLRFSYRIHLHPKVEDPCEYIILGKHVSRCRRGNSLAGWWNAPALNPKMRRGLSVLPVRWSQEEHMNTHKGLEWFGPPERKTLLHCVMY
jgi:hypothetical protein